MGQEVTYRLIFVRPDGTSELIATGISDDRANAMRQFPDTQALKSKLVIEPEHQHDGSRVL
jgi:hypothetical protein